MDDRPSLSVLSNISSIIFSFAFLVFMSGSRLSKNSPSGSGVFPSECYFMYSMNHLSTAGGTRWDSWFRNCATRRKVAGSISDGVNGIFYWHNPSGQPNHLRVPIVLKSRSLNLLKPSGPVQACSGIALPLFINGHFLHEVTAAYNHCGCFHEKKPGWLSLNTCRNNSTSLGLRHLKTIIMQYENSRKW